MNIIIDHVVICFIQQTLEWTAYSEVGKWMTMVLKTPANEVS